MTDERDEVDKLAAELFRDVQKHQGYFFLGDGETFRTKAEFFNRVQGRLAHGLEACRKMQAFLRKHGRC